MLEVLEVLEHLRTTLLDHQKPDRSLLSVRCWNESEAFTLFLANMAAGWPDARPHRVEEDDDSGHLER